MPYQPQPNSKRTIRRKKRNRGALVPSRKVRRALRRQGESNEVDKRTLKPGERHKVGLSTFSGAGSLNYH